MSWNPFSSPVLKKALDRTVGDPTKRIISTFARMNSKGVSYNDMIIAEAAMRHPVVYRVLNKIALSVQGIPWYCEATGEKGVPRPSNKMINQINSVLMDPNDMMNADQLRYWLTLNKAVFGRFGFKVGRSLNDNVGAIYPLEAPYLESVISKSGTLEGWRYGSGQNVETLRTRRAVDPARQNNFSGPFAYEYITPGLRPSAMLVKANDKNNTPLNSLGLPSEIISMLLQRAHDTASGRPNLKFIVAAEKTLDAQQEDELKGEFDERQVGADQSGNLLLLTNTSIDVHTLDDGMSDIHSKVPLDDMTRMIYAAYGVPIALGGIGSADAAKFAGNFEASRQSFYEDTIVPSYCDPIAQSMTAAICPPGCAVFFDYDAVPAIAYARAKKAKELVTVEFLTDEEKREMSGFPPKKDKGDASSEPEDKTTDA